MADKIIKMKSTLIHLCEDKQIIGFKEKVCVKIGIVDSKGKPFTFIADFFVKKTDSQKEIIYHHKDRNEIVQLKLALLRQIGYTVMEY